MMSPESLWLRVRECFDADDGSFPTISIVDLTAIEVAALYQGARTGTELVNPDASFWDLERREDVRLDEVPNAASLVAERRAAGFAFAVTGLEVHKIRLPNLGFQIFESVVSVHYQMGPAWGQLQVYGFFLWLKDVVSATKRGRIDLSIEGPPESGAFLSAWAEFSLD